VKVGDLVREDWEGGRLGVVVSKIRRSTLKDGVHLGELVVAERPCDVVEVLLTRDLIKVVRDIETLELVSESR
jgi:hypothetical protein